MRIAMISGAGAGAAGIAYVSLTANPAASAALPAVLAFAACPAMCAAMGGAMWLSRRFKKRNNAVQTTKNNVSKQSSGENRVEIQSDDDKEIVQIQHQNQRKRRAKQPDDVDEVNS